MQPRCNRATTHSHMRHTAVHAYCVQKMDVDSMCMCMCMCMSTSTRYSCTLKARPCTDIHIAWRCSVARYALSRSRTFYKRHTAPREVTADSTAQAHHSRVVRGITPHTALRLYCYLRNHVYASSVYAYDLEYASSVSASCRGLCAGCRARPLTLTSHGRSLVSVSSLLTVWRHAHSLPPVPLTPPATAERGLRLLLP